MSTDPTEDMRQHFQSDGQPERLDCGTAGANCAVGAGSAEYYRAEYHAGYLTQRRGSFRTTNPHPGDAAKARAWDQGYMHAQYHERHRLPHLHLPKVQSEPRSQQNNP